MVSDPYSYKTAGDMIIEEMNQRSHATQSFDKEYAEERRKNARDLVSQTFSNGGSVEYANELLGAQYPELAMEFSSIVEQQKTKHGNVPETKEEAEQRKQEAHQQAGQLLGGMASQPQEEESEKKRPEGVMLDAAAIIAASASFGKWLDKLVEKGKGVEETQEPAYHAAAFASAHKLAQSGLTQAVDETPLSPIDAKVMVGTPMPARQQGQAETLTI